jgi:hypothetical protein
MPKDIGNKIKWDKKKKRVRSNFKAAVWEDKYRDADKYTKFSR